MLNEYLSFQSARLRLEAKPPLAEVSQCSRFEDYAPQDRLARRNNPRFYNRIGGVTLPLRLHGAVFPRPNRDRPLR